jgi:hypothetical protein
MIFLLCLAVLSTEAARSSDIVETSFGKLQGSLTSDARIFSGIPYAEAPTKVPLSALNPQTIFAVTNSSLQIMGAMGYISPRCP